MKKNYNRRYLKKDNTISVYNFNQEIKHIDPEIKKLKQDIRPFINKMSKDQLVSLHMHLQQLPHAPEKA
jgi:hypothetical protein